MHRALVTALITFALGGCSSEEGGVADNHAGTGATGGIGVDGGGGLPAGGSGGSGGSATGGAPSCEASAPTSGSQSVVEKDVPVTSDHSQRAIAVAFDAVAQAWGLANVILDNGNFPLELRRGSESGGKLTFSDRVLALDASAPSTTNTFDPSLAAATDSSRMLLVWADDRLGNGNGLLEIFGQFFDLTGALPQKIGANFSISQRPATDEWRPHAVFDAASKSFWVAWADDRELGTVSGGRFEYARTVGLDGALGSELALGDKTTWQDGVHAAVGSSGALFVWSEFSEAEVFGRYRARLSSAASGNLIELYKSSTLSPAPPAAAWDSKRCRFLVVWQETASANAIDKQVSGALLGPDGSVVKPRFQLTTQPAGAGAPHLDYATATRSFLLTFGSWEDANAYVLELDGEGVPLGAPSSLHATVPQNGTYHHELAASDGPVLVISNDDYVRIDATLLDPG